MAVAAVAAIEMMLRNLMEAIDGVLARANSQATISLIVIEVEAVLARILALDPVLPLLFALYLLNVALPRVLVRNLHAVDDETLHRLQPTIVNEGDLARRQALHLQPLREKMATVSDIDHTTENTSIRTDIAVTAARDERESARRKKRRSVGFGAFLIIAADSQLLFRKGRAQ